MRTIKILLLGTLMMVGAAYATDVPANKIVTTKAYVDTEVATRQPLLNPQGTDLTNNVVMYTDTAGGVEPKPISDHLVAGSGETQATLDGALPTVGAVNTGLAAKQNILGQNKTAGNVATYTGTAGVLGEHAVYNGSAAYNANGLVEAQHVNTAIQTGLNNHITCGGSDSVSGNCWLYTINTQSAGTIYTPHTSGN